METVNGASVKNLFQFIKDKGILTNGEIMKNLLIETENKLIQNGKTWNDVCWIGNSENTISINQFKKFSNKEYDSGYGSPNVSMHLIIVGNDWWLERHEYDGSEWWEYKQLPIKPEKKTLKNIVFFRG